MASAERRSVRAALEACEEKLLETAAALEEMTKRADDMKSQAHTLREQVAARDKSIVRAREMLRERVAQASVTLRSVRSLQMGDIQRTTTRRGRTSYYKRLGF